MFGDIFTVGIVLLAFLILFIVKNFKEYFKYKLDKKIRSKYQNK